MKSVVPKLAKLVQEDDLSLRAAAIKVISALGISSPAIVKALGSCLSEPHEELQLAALHGLARLGPNDCIGQVVPLVLVGGKVREKAVQVLEGAGPRAIPHLTKLYADADFHGRRATIGTLARIGGPVAIRFMLKILPDESFELQKYLIVQISESIDRLSQSGQATIYPLVSRLAGRNAAPQVLMAAAILLGHFTSKPLTVRARQTLRSLAAEKNPVEVRRYAMVSFARLSQGVKLTTPEIQFVRKALCDEDWYNVAQYALAVFKTLPIPKKDRLQIIDLLKTTPHFSVHVYVFERLETMNRPDVASAIIPFLADGRFRVREAAESALKKMPSAMDNLLSMLMDTSDLEVTQRINSVLRDFPPEVQRKHLDKACKRLLALYEDNDPHYEAFLEFVRAVDSEPLRKMVYDRVATLKSRRRGDRWHRILRNLQLLWDHHLIDAEGRYLLGLASLHVNSKELAPAARRNHLGLKVLRALIYDDPNQLIRRLRAEKELTPADFYFLGFHFSEEGGAMRPFGVAMLRHVTKKFPKNKIAPSAERKLALQVALMEEEEAEAAESARRAEARAARRAGGERKSEAGAKKKPASSGDAGASKRSKAAAKKRTDATKKSSAKKKVAGTKKKPAAKKSAKKKAPTKKKTTKKKSGSAKKATKKKATKKKATKKKATKKKATKKKATKKKAPTRKKSISKKPTKSKKPRSGGKTKTKGKSRSRAAAGRKVGSRKKTAATGRGSLRARPGR